MDLKGHSASVVSLSFSGDSHRSVLLNIRLLIVMQCCVCIYCRMATVSKDGSWKFWDIDGVFSKIYSKVV